MFEAVDASVALGGHPIVSDLTLRVMRGDRIGLIGPNGSGKTTLLRLLLGELTPDTGTMRQGSNLDPLIKRHPLRLDISSDFPN